MRCYPAPITDFGMQSSMQCTQLRRSSPVREGPLRLAVFVLAILFVLFGLFGIGATGCANSPFGRGRPSREAAIAHCIETTPAESVPYADRFAACMEEQGWVYTAPSD